MGFKQRVFYRTFFVCIMTTMNIMSMPFSRIKIIPFNSPVITTENQEWFGVDGKQILISPDGINTYEVKKYKSSTLFYYNNAQQEPIAIKNIQNVMALNNKYRTNSHNSLSEQQIISLYQQQLSLVPRLISKLGTGLGFKPQGLLFDIKQRVRFAQKSDIGRYYDECYTDMTDPIGVRFVKYILPANWFDLDIKSIKQTTLRKNVNTKDGIDNKSTRTRNCAFLPKSIKNKYKDLDKKLIAEQLQFGKKRYNDEEIKTNLTEEIEILSSDIKKLQSDYDNTLNNRLNGTTNQKKLDRIARDMRHIDDNLLDAEIALWRLNNPNYNDLDVFFQERIKKWNNSRINSNA